jgi:NAD(P)-dependent dehydrogenase (short-subunit alcohol dehydrogenase family)
MNAQVLVTGGSRGIGEAIVRCLVGRGYRVHAIARHREELEKTARTMAPHGEVTYDVVDLAKRDEIRDFCRSWSSPLYALINNAGIARVEWLRDGGDDWFDDTSSWDDVLDTNLTGTYLLTKGLRRHIPRGGRIVNMSSQLGKEGRAGYSAYCASKFGLIGMTKCWAKELGPDGITVNALCPGWVRTEQALGDMARLGAEKGVSAEEFYREVCGPIEYRRFTEPEEVANLVAFLVSPEGSGVTGRAWLMHTIWNDE